LSVAPLTTVVMNAVDDRQAGVASGVNNSAARLAGVLAIALLTVLAVRWFAAGLDRNLGAAGVPDALRLALLADAHRLAEIPLPTDSTMAVAELRAIVETSYVSAFRVVMFACAGAASAAALVAWLFLRPAPDRGLDQPAIEVIDFEPRYAADFRRLNVEWLEQYFRVEPVDLDVLEAPQEKIIDKGGAVFLARSGDEIVGTCALKHDGDGVYELTKMGVTTRRRGGGIGAALLGAAIDRFVALGGRSLYLETNRILEPAIRLYEHFGFVDQGRRKPGSVYQRSNVYMIWNGPPASC
jgi:putative acetyltransferase